MHKNSLRIMRYFARKYAGDAALVLDVGSRVVNSRRLGCYGNIFSRGYVGLDVIPGENVDVVASYAFPFGDETFDVVISGQAFEHAEYPWVLLREMARVLRRGGLCCVIAPWNGDIHRIPLDTYRFFPDGMVALAKWGGLDVLKTDRLEGDTYLIARKP